MLDKKGLTNAFPTSAIVVCEVTTLAHEPRDHAVEPGPLVLQLTSANTRAPAPAELAKVSARDRHHVVQQLGNVVGCGRG